MEIISVAIVGRHRTLICVDNACLNSAYLNLDNGRRASPRFVRSSLGIVRGGVSLFALLAALFSLSLLLLVAVVVVVVVGRSVGGLFGCTSPLRIRLVARQQQAPPLGAVRQTIRFIASNGRVCRLIRSLLPELLLLLPPPPPSMDVASSSSMQALAAKQSHVQDNGAGAPSQFCAGCHQRIQDRYLLEALDKNWHEDCLKVSSIGEHCHTLQISGSSVQRLPVSSGRGWIEVVLQGTYDSVPS